MKKFSEAVLAPHKHMSKKASPYHAHSQGLVYTPKGKEEVRPIDTADAGYGGESVSDAEGGEADAGKASKKAVSPMKMQTLVKANEETERERLMKLRSFAFKNREKGLGKAMMEDEQIDELKKSTLASYAKKATDDVSYHSFTAGTMSAKDPERLAQDKKAMKRQSGVIKAIDRLTKEEVEQVDEAEYVPTQRSNFTGKRHLKRDHSDELGSRYVFSTDPAKMKKSYSTEKGQKNAANRNVANLKATIKSSLGKHSKPNLPEEVEQVNEERVAIPDDLNQKLVKITQQLHKSVSAHAKQRNVIKGLLSKDKKDTELDERNMENKAKKDNVVRQVGTHAFIKHGTDAGSPKMTGRKVMSDPKVKSSKVADMYRKLPSMEEATNVTDYNPKSQGGTRVELLRKLAKSKSPEHATAARKAGATQDELKKAMTSEEYQVVAHSKTGEKFKSGVYKTKQEAQSKHYKLAKSGEHKDIKLVKVSEENDGTEADAGEYGYEGDMAMSQLKSIIRNAKDLHDLMEPQTDLPEWVQSKITLAADYIQTAADYWRSEKEEVVNEGKMKNMATNKAEDERLAAHAASVLGGPVRKKEGPPGKKPLGARLAASAARRAMKSVSEKKMSKVPRVGEMEMTLEEYIDI